MVLVRIANQRDIAEIIEIMQMNLLKNKNTENAASKAGFLRGEYSADYFAKAIADFPKQIALVAIQNDKIVGYSIGQSFDLVEQSIFDNLRSFCDVNKNNFYHRQIAKLPNTKGVGMALVTKLIEQLRQEKYEATLCMIAEKPLKNQASITFHQSQNFTRAGEFYDSARNLDFGVFYQDL